MECDLEVLAREDSYSDEKDTNSENPEGDDEWVGDDISNFDRFDEEKDVQLPVRRSYVGTSFNLQEEYKESAYKQDYEKRAVDKKLTGQDYQRRTGDKKMTAPMQLTSMQKKPRTSIMKR